MVELSLRFSKVRRGLQAGQTVNSVFDHFPEKSSRVATSDFELTVRRESTSDKARFILDRVNHATIGKSPAGTTIVLVGTAWTEERADRIAQQYETGGFDVLADELGESGALIIDPAMADVMVVAPPRVAIRQLFWRVENNSLHVASRLAGVFPNGRPRGLRPQAIYEYVYFNVLPGPSCIFDGVHKLETGHTLRWKDNTAVTARYWSPVFDERSIGTEKQASGELFRVLRAAVGRHVNASSSAGAFLSGGLDSSTVAGLASESRPGLKTVTMGFDAAGYDEMEYARIASRQFGTHPLEYYVTPDDVLDSLPAVASAFSEPFGNSSAAAVFHCARVAREAGLDLLLAGDGGDELFGGNERYAKQLVFEHYKKLPGAIRRGALEPLLNRAGKITTAFPIGKALSYVQQAIVPLPDRLQSYNFLQRHDPSEVFAPEFLDAVDTELPMQALRDEYFAPQSTGPVNRMLFLDWKFTLHDNDLVKVNTMCGLAGMNVAYPMLDPDVIDFSMRLPANWKVRRGELRWFYKRAMHGFLPPQIIKKTKHGFGLPFGIWTASHPGLKKLAEASLGSLATRGFFNPAFLRETLRLHQEVHAKYYGELVWILMVLELWLQGHAPNAKL
jgi:asparagine synthase (glutamine-hydrolysing)